MSALRRLWDGPFGVVLLLVALAAAVAGCDTDANVRLQQAKADVLRVAVARVGCSLSGASVVEDVIRWNRTVAQSRVARAIWWRAWMWSSLWAEMQPIELPDCSADPLGVRGTLDDKGRFVPRTEDAP